MGKSDRSCRNRDAAILQLPTDILFLVADNLALHDKFFLSQTCQALRHIMFRDWDSEISRLSFNDKLRFWTGLACTLPSYWACAKCCKLHLINTSDTPTSLILGWQYPSCGADLSRGDFIRQGYSVQHHHIQIALKLSRLRNKHEKYFAALMDTYTYTSENFTTLFIRSFTAEPRIINKRFILHEEWNIRNDTSVISPLFQHNDISVCPHLCVYGGGLECSFTWKRIVRRLARQRNKNREFKEIIQLENGILSAFKSPGEWICISCPRCPTDCQIKASTDGRTATIRAWHDFGVEGSPMDTGWSVHVKSGGNKDWLYQEPSLDYAHGSIRNLWLADIS